MLKNPKQSSTSIFRKLIGNIITENAEWAKRNGKTMFEDYGQEIYAALGIIKNKILIKLIKIEKLKKNLIV